MNWLQNTQSYFLYEQIAEDAELILLYYRKTLFLLIIWHDLFHSRESGCLVHQGDGRNNRRHLEERQALDLVRLAHDKGKIVEDVAHFNAELEVRDERVRARKGVCAVVHDELEDVGRYKARPADGSGKTRQQSCLGGGHVLGL